MLTYSISSVYLFNNEVSCKGPLSLDLIKISIDLAAVGVIIIIMKLLLMGLLLPLLLRERRDSRRRRNPGEGLGAEPKLL